MEENLIVLPAVWRRTRAFANPLFLFRVFVILLMYSDDFVDNAMPSNTNFSRPSCPIQNSAKYEMDWGITKTRKNENTKKKKRIGERPCPPPNVVSEMKRATHIIASQRAGECPFHQHFATTIHAPILKINS